MGACHGAEGCEGWRHCFLLPQLALEVGCQNRKPPAQSVHHAVIFLPSRQEVDRPPGWDGWELLGGRRYPKFGVLLHTSPP